MRYGMLVAALAMCAGCTSLAAKRHALNQEVTSTDIRYQEVVDNLALIYHDPAALPAYCSIFAGSVQVNDSEQIVSQTTVGPGAVGAQVFTPQLTRQATGNWSLDPINTPEKLEAMRAACQWVLFGSGFAWNHDCDRTLLNPEQALCRMPAPACFRTRHFGVWNRLCCLPPTDAWLWRGRDCDCPGKACYEGRCGEDCVCVLPEGMGGLANFTLILQDIARVDINSPTLICIQPFPSDLQFPTKAPDTWPCCTGPYVATKPYCVADTNIDGCGRLAPDTVYFPWRVENYGSDAALRSQITTAAAGLH
jgi:hypothetical protein